jgi:hypothetical protein
MSKASVFAGIINKETGEPVGIAFPVDVGYKVVSGPEAWLMYLKEQEILREEHALLLAYIRKEVSYLKVRHIVEEVPF